MTHTNKTVPSLNFGKDHTKVYYAVIKKNQYSRDDVRETIYQNLRANAAGSKSQRVGSVKAIKKRYFKHIRRAHYQGMLLYFQLWLEVLGKKNALIIQHKNHLKFGKN